MFTSCLWEGSTSPPYYHMQWHHLWELNHVSFIQPPLCHVLPGATHDPSSSVVMGDPLWACGHVCSFIFAFSLKSFIQWVNQDYANFSPKMFCLVVTQIRASPGSHQEQKCICKSQIHDLNYVRWVSIRYILVIFYKENNTTKREREATGKERRWGGVLQSEPAPTSLPCRMDAVWTGFTSLLNSHPHC